MKEISELQPTQLSSVQAVFTDIDDTLSSNGKITSDAFSALWRLHDADLKIVIVTGRPAGWCDHIARFWPVTAVVGENGGFYFYHDGSKLVRHYLYNDEERAGFREKLNKVRDTILREVPGAGIASDQPYREYDVAIDFCEDVEPLDQTEVLRIKQIFEEAGAHAKVSSIHVNGWYGDFDKLTTSVLCAKDLLHTDPADMLNTSVYCGDSPNDESMFAFFPLSFGMANVRPFLPMMDKHPSFVTVNPSGQGFCEVANAIMKAQGR